MNNADKFKQIFDLYATELWAMSEKDFLAWLNAESDVPGTNVGDLISRQAAIKAIDDLPNCYNGYSDTYDKAYIIGVLEELPSIDTVPLGAYKQTRRERDMAIAQLAEIGKSLCEKMDNVATVVRCKDCKYYKEGVVLSPQKFCFRLKDKDGAAIGYNFAEDDFCSYGERSEE